MIAKAEDEKASAFAISKEDIDSVLQKGSGVADGKYRIYRQFQKGVDRQKSMERAAVRISSPMVSAVILGMTAKVLPLTETALIPITTLC